MIRSLPGRRYDAHPFIGVGGVRGQVFAPVARRGAT